MGWKLIVGLFKCGNHIITRYVFIMWIRVKQQLIRERILEDSVYHFYHVYLCVSVYLKSKHIYIYNTLNNPLI